jgi:hypothetical protein
MNVPWLALTVNIFFTPLLFCCTCSQHFVICFWPLFCKLQTAIFSLVCLCLCLDLDLIEVEVESHDAEESTEEEEGGGEAPHRGAGGHDPAHGHEGLGHLRELEGAPEPVADIHLHRTCKCMYCFTPLFLRSVSYYSHVHSFTACTLTLCIAGPGSLQSL